MGAPLRGRVVVITGASAGIGRACAHLFAREGAHVVAAARRADRITALQQEIEASGGRCLAVPTDVAERAQVQRLLDATLEHFGGVDVWVNNAGYGLAASIEQTTPEEMEQIWRVNYLGAFHGCQVALQQMRRQGHGHIINVSSMAARFPLPLHGAYTVTKYAMNALSEVLEMELEGTGIRVSAVMPNVTETEFTSAVVKKIPDATGGIDHADPPERVARRIGACARRPRSKVMFIPLPRLTLAAFDLLPSLWKAVGRRYIQIRTNGAGVPVPGEADTVPPAVTRAAGPPEA